VLHFSTERIRRVVECFARCKNFPVAFARLASGDAWLGRDPIAAQRKHNDDWYFQCFASTL
jgi:hypothetical protein